jgi:hypothetical protein
LACCACLVPTRPTGAASKREREARRVLHEQERKDRRDTFQRDTILALQDAISDLYEIGAQHVQMRAGPANSGNWPANPVEISPPDGYLQAMWALNKLRSRVFDQELRELSTGIRVAMGNMIWAQDEGTMQHHAEEITELSARFHARLTVLLAELF